MIRNLKERNQELDRLSEYADVEVTDHLAAVTEIPKQPEFYKIPRRFGSIPVDELPLGCDKDKQYYKMYPRVVLPFQKAETVSFGHAKLKPNKLFWGDNLHVMRMLPSNSINLIYIDPPFFSGRNYNILFGDQNEIRSFTDIWEGGMPSYLMWLNARLLEMKRLLKPSGSIYVHLDSHAVHYVKTEMDKIFGYDNFRNEIIWKRTFAHGSAQQWGNIHDSILFYTKSKDYTWTKLTLAHEEEYLDKHYRYEDENGRYRFAIITGPGTTSGESGKEWRGYDPTKIGRHWAVPKRAIEQLQNKEIEIPTRLLDQLELLYQNGYIHFPKKKDGSQGAPSQKLYLTTAGSPIQDLILDVPPLTSQAKERLGYPTQKPESLIERLVLASSNEGDIVADFFCGGGATPAVAQKLNRRWIACDQSRVAVAITQGRLEALHEKSQRAGTQQTLLPIPDISVEYWGTYEIPALNDLTDIEFRSFVVSAYGGRAASGGGCIHGFKHQTPLFVGSSNQKTRVTKDAVLEFARYIAEIRGMRKGIMIAWSFAPSARLAVEKLKDERRSEIDLIRITLIQIGSEAFRSHITKLHEEYKSMLTFILPPEVSFQYKRISPMQYEFDVSESIALNSGANIINVQWDFNYKGRFTPTQGFAYGREGKGDAIKPQFRVKYKFGGLGKTHIACRVQDDLGGEKIRLETITVK